VSTEVIVAIVVTVGSVITALIAGIFALASSRASKKVKRNTVDLAALSDHALSLLNYYKSRSEVAEAKCVTQDDAIAALREIVDRLERRQDALLREAGRRREQD
jgi:broad specificity polyphosphatase/5'/3'-nucleotidase SurE